MAEKELAILVRAKGAIAAAREIGKVDGAIGKLGKNVRQGVGNLTANLAKIGIAASFALAAAVGAGVRSLAELSQVQQQTAAVIASTGAKAGVTAAQIRSMAEALEDVTTVDDKVIQTGQNMLLTFTNIGSKAFPQATKAMVDMAIAMNGGSTEGLDLKATAIQLGKALNDPLKGMTALRKVGVAFTDQQIKQVKALMKAGKVYEAQQIILKELEVEFGNAGKAAGQDFGSDLRRLQDTGEDLTMALAKGLMPVITRASTWLRTKLADPAVMAQISALGDGLAAAGQSFLDFLEKVDWDSIKAGVGATRDIAGSVVGMFMGMPDWVKQAVITGWGLNKLTGGALTGIVGALASGVIRGVLGINAGVVNVRGAVVNGGGVPGVGGAGGKGGIGPMAAALGSAFAIAAAIAVQQKVAGESGAKAAEVQATGMDFLKSSPTLAQLNLSIAGIDKGIADLRGLGPLSFLAGGDDALRKMEDLKAAYEKGRGEALASDTRTEAMLRTNLTRQQAAPIVTVNVNANITTGEGGTRVQYTSQQSTSSQYYGGSPAPALSR